jgi:hypothetical protein
MQSAHAPSGAARFTGDGFARPLLWLRQSRNLPLTCPRLTQPGAAGRFRLHGRPPVIRYLTLAVLLVGAATAVASEPGHGAALDFPPDLATYNDAGQPVLERLGGRIEVNPFNLVGTLIFLLAVTHTFLCSRFTAIAHRLERQHELKLDKGEVPRTSVSHGGRLMHFLGEVEVVFGLWAAVLLVAIILSFNWPTAVNYVNSGVNYTEAIFVFVIMALASTRPILKLAEVSMQRVAGLLGGSLKAWWFSILTLGPLLGSFITEPAAMTISALLLMQKFYVLEPSNRLKYATLGLLFVNTSTGGTLTHFAAPPVLMAAEPWGWDTAFMLGHFGWKAVVGILISNAIFMAVFRRELSQLEEPFAIRSLRHDILTRYFSRDDMESKIDALAAETGELDEVNARVRGLMENYSRRVEGQLKERYLEQMSGRDIDMGLARSAFEEQFADVRLSRLQREVPKALPKVQRAPYQDPRWDLREDPVPRWVILVHVLFMVWTIVNAHSPALFVPGLLFFLGFAAVTADYQNTINLQRPLLVAFFLGGLVTLGGVQGWWIEPVLGSLEAVPLMAVSTVLTAFNDNAAITYLATLVPDFTPELKYAVVAGAVAGGGLTVIANAPNPAGQAILKDCFEHGVSPWGLFKAALIPTLIMFSLFAMLR